MADEELPPEEPTWEVPMSMMPRGVQLGMEAQARDQFGRPPVRKRRWWQLRRRKRR